MSGGACPDQEPHYVYLDLFKNRMIAIGSGCIRRRYDCLEDCSKKQRTDTTRRRRERLEDDCKNFGGPGGCKWALFFYLNAEGRKTPEYFVVLICELIGRRTFDYSIIVDILHSTPTRLAIVYNPRSFDASKNRFPTPSL